MILKTVINFLKFQNDFIKNCQNKTIRYGILFNIFNTFDSNLSQTQRYPFLLNTFYSD